MHQIKRNYYSILIYSLTIITAIGFTLFYINNPLYYEVATVILLFFSAYVFYKELKVLYKYFFRYMFNLNTFFFKKKLERPRLFMYLTFGTLSLFFLYQFRQIDPTLNFYFRTFITITYLLTYLSFTLLLLFTWTDKFERVLIPQIQKRIPKNDFKINWSREQLKKIYTNLYDLDLISILDENEDVNDSEIFVNLLLSGELPKKPVFNLKMNHIYTKYFYDKFKNNSSSLTLKVFSMIFENNNGIINPVNLRSSVSNSKNTKSEEIIKKEKEQINSIFKDQ